MEQETGTFRPEDHRGHLLVLAQIQLRRATSAAQARRVGYRAGCLAASAGQPLPHFAENRTRVCGLAAGNPCQQARMQSASATAKRDPRSKRRSGNVWRVTRRIEDLIPADRTSVSTFCAAKNVESRQALAMLPEDQRAAVECHHLEGYSVVETAAQMQRRLPEWQDCCAAA